MAGKIILGLAAILWAYWTYESTPLFRHPEHYKAEEFFLMKCWGCATQ